MKMLRASSAVVLLCIAASNAAAQTADFNSPSLLPLPQTSFAGVPGYALSAPAYAPPRGGDLPMMSLPAIPPLHTLQSAEPLNSQSWPVVQGVSHAAVVGYDPALDNSLAGLDNGTFDEAVRSPADTECPAACMDSCCEPCCPPLWFGAIGGLIMTRDSPNHVWLTYLNADPRVGMLSAQQSVDDWRGGFEVSFGRHIDEVHALEASYWTLDAMDKSRTIVHGGNGISTSLNFNGVPLGAIFDSARVHVITRRNEFHNVEVNLLRLPLLTEPCNNFGVNWMFGVRFFRFDEGLLFTGAQNDLGVDPSNEVNYDVDVENNLIGPQFGARANWQLLDRWLLFVTPKVGVYGNAINHETQLYLTDGTTAAGFPVRSHETDVSVLAELNVGLNYQLNPGWSAYVGYRLVALSGVALSDENIPQFLADTNGIADIDTKGQLLLHGGMAGIQLNY